MNKMKQRNMIYKGILTIVATIILFSFNINAFAVSSQYYGGNPMYLQPGETTNIKLMLQNQAGARDVIIKMSITEGSDVIEPVESNDVLTVPKGNKIDVNFIVTAPSSAKKGDTFPISIEFTTVTSSEGPIALGGSIGKGFNLVIGEPSDFEVRETKFPLTALYVITAIILGIITLIIIRKKLSKNKSRY